MANPSAQKRNCLERVNRTRRPRCRGRSALDPPVSLFGVGLCPARERLSSGALRRMRLLPPPPRPPRRQSADDRRAGPIVDECFAFYSSSQQQRSLKALSIRPKESSPQHKACRSSSAEDAPGRTLGNYPSLWPTNPQRIPKNATRQKILPTTTMKIPTFFSPIN